MNTELPVKQNKDMMMLLCRCAFAIDLEILMSYIEGKVIFPGETLADLDIKTMFELLTVPYERNNEFLERSKEIYDQLDVKILSNFVVDIERIGYIQFPNRR